MSLYNRKKVAISLSNEQNEFGVLLKTKIINHCGLNDSDVFMHYSENSDLNKGYPNPNTYFHDIFTNCKIAILLLSKEYPHPKSDGSIYCIDELNYVLSNSSNVLINKKILPYFYHRKEDVIESFNKPHSKELFNVLMSTVLIDPNSELDGDNQERKLEKISSDVKKKLQEDHIDHLSLFEIDCNNKDLTEVEIADESLYLGLENSLGEMENGKSNNDFKITRKRFNDELKQKIAISNIIFIEGGILKGKSMALKEFSKNFKDQLYSVPTKSAALYSGTKPPNKYEIYHEWVKDIISMLNVKSAIDEPSNPRYENLSFAHSEFIDSIHNLGTFKKELSGKRETLETGDLPSLLRMISKINKILNNDLTIYLAINIDDFQKYTTDEVFDQIRSDVSNYQDNEKYYDYHDFNIKLFIITRYFPMAKPRLCVVLLPDLDAELLKSLFNPLFHAEKISIEIQKQIISLVLEYTNGHIWFVLRLIRAFLKLRLRKCRLNPLLLIDKILNDLNIWFFDINLFSIKTVGHSEYLKELHTIIKEYPNEQDVFYNTLSEHKNHFEINDEIVQNNQILRQSGILRAINHETIYEMNINKIIRTHFTKQNINKLVF